MKTCNIMLDVDIPEQNDPSVTITSIKQRADMVTQAQIWERFKGEPWFVFQSDHCGETPPFMWTVLLSGIWHVHGRGKGYTFDQALSRAFNQFIYRNDKFWKEQEAMTPKATCCAKGIANISYVLMWWYCDGKEIATCPYCGETPNSDLIHEVDDD